MELPLWVRPRAFHLPTPPPARNHTTTAGELPKMLLDQYNTWVPFYVWSSRAWARVSAQIYNDISDFEMLAAAVLALCGKD